MRGALLIGGKSSRMGQPKHLLEVAGEPLGQRLCNLLRKLTGHQPLISGEGDISGWGLDRVADREQGAGPLSALLGLFDAHPNETWLVLATDMPAMNENALSWLIKQAAASEKPTTWPRFIDRHSGEPLAAIYKPDIIPIMENAWQEGIRGPTRAVQAKYRHQPEIPLHLETVFKNANTPDEWQELIASL